jgi:hypothetical protein
MIFHRRQMRWEEGSHTHMARWMHVNAHRKKHRVWPSASSIIRASRAHPLSLRQLVEVGGRTGKEAVIRVGGGRARIGGPQRMVSGWTKKKCRGKYRRIILCWDVDKKSTLGVELQRQRTEGVVLFFRLVSLLILGKLRRGCKLWGKLRKIEFELPRLTTRRWNWCPSK